MVTRTGKNRRAVRVAEPARYRFTVQQYQRMGEAGILGEDERVELIRGEIIQMAAIGSRHAAGVNDLNLCLLPQVLGRALLSVQNPVELPEDSEPQPDLLLLRHREDHYRNHLPLPADVLLAIEVSDRSLAYDLRTKIPLYGERGIPEVWDWDIPHRQVHVFRKLVDGVYQEQFIVRPGEVLEPVALPGMRVDVTAIFGPPP